MGGVFYNAHKAMMRGTYPADTIHIHTSHYDWFAGRAPQCNLMMFVDDSTGRLFYALLSHPGDTETYNQAVRNFTLQHDLPEALCIDRESPFYTQYSDVRANLGRGHLWDFLIAEEVEFHSDSTPESRAKIEHIDLLVKIHLTCLLRMRNIPSIEKANYYLPGLITKINAQLVT